MKTLYLTNSSSSNIWIDKDTDEVGSVRTESRYSIKDIILVEDPMHVVYQDSEYKRELDVKKGDIMIVFYKKESLPENRIVVVKNKNWAKNIIDLHKREEEEKLRWAAEKANDAIPCGCENCGESVG